ncbi:hypothetical protein CH35J_011983 [Colletotrichum higginsianum]|uniref:Uncharacterized protein n=1 Tax=Colletotrichum higginsianum TaxID=80884 RepID=A0A4T0VDX5_9PEZI|nr:hypothetical protein CH35J_011983 [Colletotrichum higginsianum]
MAGIFRHAISWLYTALAVSILVVWSLLALAGVAFTATDSDPGLVQLIALPSLLTFLVAKLVVAAASTPTTTAAGETITRRNTTATSGAQPSSSGSNLATWVATADHGSPQGALMLLLFSATWLLYITRFVFALFSMVLLSAFIVLAASLEGADSDTGKKPSNDEGVQGGFTAALADLEAQSGTGLVKHMVEHPWVSFETLATIWSAYALLGMYVAAYAFGATRKVLTAPLEAWTRGGEDLAVFQKYREVETHVLGGERGRSGLAAN